jgi:hypothetical protein
MPSRLATLAIVLFWLGTSALLFQREIWPRLEPGAAPPFALYETDDSQPSILPGRWAAWHSGLNGKPVRYTITTSVVHHDKNKEDEFELIARLETPQPENVKKPLSLIRLETAYWVHRRRMVRFETSAAFRSTGSGPQSEINAEYTGAVKDGVCSIRREKTIKPQSDAEKIELEVSRTGTVLMPLHPLDRMEGLKGGHHWGLHLLDPTDSTSAAADTAPPRLVWVNAEVRRDPEKLRHAGGEIRRCWVVEYSGDGGEVGGSTWVDVADARVLKMTIRLGAHDSWELVRK